MRPRIQVLSAVAALATLSNAAQAASVRYDYLDGAHWDVAPNAASGRPRTVVIVDATDNPRVLEALRTFKAEWNAMRTDPSLVTLPPVDLSTARASDACSGARLHPSPAAPGDVVVCLDDRLASAAVGGPYLVDERGHTELGVVKLRTRTLSWADCNLRTAVAHELGHVMGLAHNDAAGLTGGPSVMMSGKRPYGRGCSAWFDGHDRAALRALYEPHARAAGFPPTPVSDPRR